MDQAWPGARDGTIGHDSRVVYHGKAVTMQRAAGLPDIKGKG